MSKTSTNLSDRLHFTIDYNDNTANIGTLKSPQKILVEFTREELRNLIRRIREEIIYSTTTY